jgi:hypothetical protein
MPSHVRGERPEAAGDSQISWLLKRKGVGKSTRADKMLCVCTRVGQVRAEFAQFTKRFKVITAETKCAKTRNKILDKAFTVYPNG